MVQSVGNENKRPGVLPYALGGAAAGTAAGWGLSKLNFTKTAKYSSWQDVLKDSKDLFKAAKEEGAADNVKEAATSVKENLRKYYENIRPTIESVKNSMTKEKTALNEAHTKFKDLWNSEATKIVEKIKDKTITIKDLDPATASEEKILKEARKYLRDNMTDDLKTAQKNIHDAANKFKELNFDEAQTKLIKEKADDAWKAVQDKVKGFKAPRTKMLAIGGAVLGLLTGAFLLRPKAKPAEEVQA